LLAWIAGHATLRRNLDAQFRSHADRKRRTMSVLTLGQMALATGVVRFALRELTDMLHMLSEPPPMWESPAPWQS